MRLLSGWSTDSGDEGRERPPLTVSGGSGRDWTEPEKLNLGGPGDSLHRTRPTLPTQDLCQLFGRDQNDCTRAHTPPRRFH